MEGLMDFVYGVVGLAGSILIYFGVVLLKSWWHYRKSRKWCERNGLDLKRIDLEGGKYGYVGYDLDNFRVYGIPKDFGEKDEGLSLGMRFREADWKGKDRMAIGECGEEIPLLYQERNGGK